MRWLRKRRAMHLLIDGQGPCPKDVRKFLMEACRWLDMVLVLSPFIFTDIQEHIRAVTMGVEGHVFLHHRHPESFFIDFFSFKPFDSGDITAKTINYLQFTSHISQVLRRES